VLRARLDGGIRSKAARGHLRRGLPVGLVWGEADGQIGFHPDEAVTGVIGAVFEQFAVCGSVRGVWLWLRDQGLRWPLQGAYRRGQDAEITWVAPTYHAVHTTLTNPAYAGAYTYGRTRSERYLDSRGVLRSRRREMPRDQWEVLITGHHEGWVTWQTYLANQQRIAGNTRPQAHQPGTGAVREGSAQLQGLASCGICGRRLAVFYDGPAKSTPGYFCTGTGTGSIGAPGTRHLRVGGSAIDAAVTGVFLAALAPAALQACLAAAQQLEDGYDTALDQWRRQLEQVRYAATRAERRYRSVDPENRLVARGLETEWETALGQLADAGAELARREQARPKTLTAAERAAILSLGDNLEQVWTAPTTTDKARKQLLRTLLEEVTVNVHRDDTEGRADLLLRWKGGAISELAVPIRRQPPKIRTDEDTIDLIRRLAVHYPDAQIAGILNRQHRRTAKGLSYTPARVQTLRFRNDIPGRRPSRDPQEGELLTVAETARELGLVPSTVHRWLNDGFIAGEQLPPPRRAVADPAHRRYPRPARRQHPRRLARHPGSHPRLRPLTSDPLATRQARRNPRCLPPHQTQERPAYRTSSPSTRAVLTDKIQQGSSVIMHPQRGVVRLGQVCPSLGVGAPQAALDLGGGTDHGDPAGLMFWLSRKTLSGS
jgi:transposase-like protein